MLQATGDTWHQLGSSFGFGLHENRLREGIGVGNSIGEVGFADKTDLAIKVASGRYLSDAFAAKRIIAEDHPPSAYVILCGKALPTDVPSSPNICANV